VGGGAVVITSGVALVMDYDSGGLFIIQHDS